MRISVWRLLLRKALGSKGSCGETLFYAQQRLSKIAQGFLTAFGKSKQDLKADAAALAVSPSDSTGSSSWQMSRHSLPAFEIANGCMGPVEQLLDELRKTILENRVAYSPSTAEAML